MIKLNKLIIKTMNTKFNIGDSVYLMYNNKPTTATIGRIIISPDKSDASVIRIIYEIRLDAGTYGINENKVFATKEELRDYVFENEPEEKPQNNDILGEGWGVIIPNDTKKFYTRIYYTFKCLDIETVGDLLNYSAEDLLKMRNFGKRSLNTVRRWLASFNLKLKGD